MAGVDASQCDSLQLPCHPMNTHQCKEKSPTHTKSNPYSKSKAYYKSKAYLKSKAYSKPNSNAASSAKTLSNAQPKSNALLLNTDTPKNGASKTGAPKSGATNSGVPVPDVPVPVAGVVMSDVRAANLAWPGVANHPKVSCLPGTVVCNRSGFTNVGNTANRDTKCVADVQPLIVDWRPDQIRPMRSGVKLENTAENWRAALAHNQVSIGGRLGQRGGRGREAWPTRPDYLVGVGGSEAVSSSATSSHSHNRVHIDCSRIKRETTNNNAILGYADRICPSYINPDNSMDRNSNRTSDNRNALGDEAVPGYICVGDMLRNNHRLQNSQSLSHNLRGRLSERGEGQQRLDSQYSQSLSRNAQHRFSEEDHVRQRLRLLDEQYARGYSPQACLLSDEDYSPQGQWSRQWDHFERDRRLVHEPKSSYTAGGGGTSSSRGFTAEDGDSTYDTNTRGARGGGRRRRNGRGGRGRNFGNNLPNGPC